MYPVKLLPDALAFAAKLNPLTYGVDALKNVIFPLEKGPMSADFSFATDITVIVLLSIAFVVTASKLLGRKG